MMTTKIDDAPGALEQAGPLFRKEIEIVQGTRLIPISTLRIDYWNRDLALTSVQTPEAWFQKNLTSQPDVKFPQSVSYKRSGKIQQYLIT